MATYMILFRFTEKGIQNIKDSPQRVEAVKKTFKAVGAEVKAFYALLGQYDTMIIAEAPNDETIAKLDLALCALGNARCETHRAFNEEEFRKIVSTLPTYESRPS